jgi:hypothetical protein
LRELFVERELDAIFWSEVLERASIDGVEIFDADYLDVSDEDTRAAGLSPGVKGKLLRLAVELVAIAQERGLRSWVMALVDRDHDDVPASLEAFVIATDRYSVENYAITEGSLDRFMAHQFGKLRGPAGASQTRRTRRNLASGRLLLQRLIPPSVEVTAARRVA